MELKVYFVTKKLKPSVQVFIICILQLFQHLIQTFYTYNYMYYVEIYDVFIYLHIYFMKYLKMNHMYQLPLCFNSEAYNL